MNRIHSLCLSVALLLCLSVASRALDLDAHTQASLESAETRWGDPYFHPEPDVTLILSHNKQQMVPKDRLDQDNVVIVNRARVRADVEHVPFFVRDPSKRPRDLFRFRIAGSEKNCNVSTEDKADARAVIEGFPLWNDDLPLSENIRKQRSACLQDGSFCFDENDLDGPWCYWPERNCNVRVGSRRDMAARIEDFPLKDVALQKAMCTHRGFCYDDRVDPVCFQPR